jgi:Ca2+/Na+ antiporter
MESALPPSANPAPVPPQPGDNNSTNVPGPIAQAEPEVLLAEWAAPARVVTPRTREYYSSLLVIVLLLSLILFFANQLVLIAVMWSFLFVTYVLASVKAETVIHQITTYGLRYRNKLYYWNQIARFWVRNNRGVLELHLETPALWGNEIILLASHQAEVDGASIENLAEVLALYVRYEEPIPSQMDKWVQWLEEKFPLERSARKSG